MAATRQRGGSARRGVQVSALALTWLFGMSCAGPNLWSDGSSVSMGKTNRGHTRSPAKLPLEGDGYVVPTRWEERGFQYGIDELVAAVERAAARVNAEAPPSTLGVADLSALRGGRSQWHASHQSGRDVDLIFYVTDEDGNPKEPLGDDMVHFDGEGKPYLPKRLELTEPYNDEDWESIRFDTARTWLLVEALLSDPKIRVQWIFISEELETLMIAHARAAKRPSWVIEYAELVMNQPRDAPPHDDHMHVRIYCPRGDRFHGCVERGVVWRHEKKSFRYAGPERYDPYMWALMSAATVMAGPG